MSHYSDSSWPSVNTVDHEEGDGLEGHTGPGPLPGVTGSNCFISYCYKPVTESTKCLQDRGRYDSGHRIRECLGVQGGLVVQGLR